MDFKELLKRYMTNVLLNEGQTFIPDNLKYFDDLAEFTQEELNVLQSIEKEVKEEQGY